MGVLNAGLEQASAKELVVQSMLHLEESSFGSKCKSMVKGEKGAEQCSLQQYHQNDKNDKNRLESNGIQVPLFSHSFL